MPMMSDANSNGRLRRILIVVGSHCAQMLSIGMSFSFGILYRELRIEFDASQSEAAWTASMFNSLLGFVGIPLSIITRRTGERRVALVGAVLLAVGMFTSMFATQMSTLYVTYGLIAGIGAGALHYCGNTILGPHFDDRWRPIAMTISNAGIPLATLILPPIMTLLIQEFDWRTTFMVLSLLSLIGIPAALTFFPPETEETFKTASNETDKPSLKASVIKLVKNINYMLFLAASVLTAFVLFIPVTFLPDIMHEFNRSSTEVTVCVMTLGCGDLIGRLLFGYLAHKMPSYIAFLHGFGYMLSGISALMIIFARSFTSSILLSALTGLGSGGANGLHSVMAAHVVSISDMRLAYGVVLTTGGFALLSGMPMAGYVTEALETQRGAYVLSGSLFVLASVLIFIIGFRELCVHKRKAIYDVAAGAHDNDICRNEDVDMQCTNVKIHQCETKI